MAVACLQAPQCAFLQMFRDNALGKLRQPETFKTHFSIEPRFINSRIAINRNGERHAQNAIHPNAWLSRKSNGSHGAAAIRRATAESRIP